MRAGFGCSLPRAAFELFSRLRAYGFELQPTGAARAVTNAHVHVKLVRARLPGVPAFGS